LPLATRLHHRCRRAAVTANLIKGIPATDAKEVRVKNPAEETFCLPGRLFMNQTLSKHKPKRIHRNRLHIAERPARYKKHLPLPNWWFPRSSGALPSSVRTLSFNPFVLIDTGLTNHSFKRLRRIATVSKIDVDNSIWLSIDSAFDPGLMRTSQFFVEAKASFPEEVCDLSICPIVQSSRHVLRE